MARAKVPNPRVSYLSPGEMAELGLEETYARQVSNTAEDREARREERRARERDKRIS